MSLLPELRLQFEQLGSLPDPEYLVAHTADVPFLRQTDLCERRGPLCFASSCRGKELTAHQLGVACTIAAASRLRTVPLTQVGGASARRKPYSYSWCKRSSRCRQNGAASRGAPLCNAEYKLGCEE